jgi:PKD repeat protein
MSENLNWLDQLKKSFQGFEPEVTGDWKHMEQRLDAADAGTTNEMARRMRNAQRIAIGATAIAAGMALWVITPTILEEENATGLGLATTTEASTKDANASYGAASARSLFSPAGDATDLFSLEGARTSNTFVIDLPSLTVKADALTEKASPTHAETPEGQRSASVEQSNTPQHMTAATEAEGEETEEALVLSPEAKLDAALAAMTASAQEACAGTEVTFALNGLDQEGSVLWNFGDGGFSQEVAPTHIYDDAGSYDITVSVRAPGDGMIRTRTVENMIVVRPKPEAAMNWEFFDATSNRARVHFINETEDASSSTWLLEQEGLTDAQAVLDVPGDYHVNLVASNKFGCQDIAVQDIHLGSRKEAIAPALFSPDGDGRYDTFMPLMLMDFKGKWELTIWDGDEQVFESSKTRRPWKGELANGGAAEVGKKYTWKLVAETPAGEKHLFVDEVLIDGE